MIPFWYNKGNKFRKNGDKIMLVGYARVSTEEQSLNRQIDMLIDYGVDKRNIYQEKISGTKVKIFLF